MDASEFQRLAGNTLAAIADRLEALDSEGKLEIEQSGGVITIEFPSGKQLVVSLHAPSQQIWLASPQLGGLHFRWDKGGWLLPDGRQLDEVINEQVTSLSG